MTADTFRTIAQSGGCAELSKRAKFKLTGADRVRYLNGQVTNDVRKATSTGTLRACVVNAKGRIEAEVYVHVTVDGQALILDADADLREALATRLDKYIVADDVTLEDVTEQWRLVHCFAGDQEDSASCDPGLGGIALKSSRYGTAGTDAWTPISTRPSCGVRSIVSPDDLETLRIIRGIPRWPQELNADAFPQEAGLEAHVMDFAKGCYIGQEVLSRIKMTGKMPRVLRRLGARDGALQVAPGMKLLHRTPEGDLKEAGAVTSVTRHPLLDRMVGLGYVRQAFEKVDSLLLADGDPPRIFGDVEITPG